MTAPNNSELDKHTLDVFADYLNKGIKDGAGKNAEESSAVTKPTNNSELEKLQNDVAVQVLGAMAQAKYGISYLLLDKKQQQYLVVDAGDTCKNLLALIHTENQRAVEEYKAIFKLADTYTFEDGTVYKKVKTNPQSKEHKNG